MNKRLSTSNGATDRSTLKTLAAELGVSACTVNKALTGKLRISEATRRKILDVAELRGYRPNRLARSLSRPVLRIGLVCPSAWPDHYRRLMDGARSRLAELSDYRITEEFVEVPDMTNGLKFMRVVQSLVADGIDGLVLALGDFPAAQRRMLWETLGTRRIPFALLTRFLEDEPALLAIEHDSHLCGNLAAELLSMLTDVSAKTAILVGSMDIPDHRLKVAGFNEEAKRRGYPSPIVAETHDMPDKAGATLRSILKKQPKTAGVYIATENIQGVLDAGKSLGLSGKMKIVATGISEPVLKGLESGIIHATLYQNERLQGRMAVDALFTFLETGRRPSPEILVAPAIVLRSNAAAFMKE